MKFTAIRGRYTPANPNKYSGDINKITYRSMWERRFMLYCDRSASIIKWSSEELHIPYISPKDDKWHNYYPDFLVTIKDAVARTVLVEINPHYQRSYRVNKAKWKYAEDYCKINNYEFKVLTEKELFY